MGSRYAWVLGALLVAATAGCGGDESVCQRTLDKINKCRSDLGQSPLNFPAECSDEVTMIGPSGPTTVALKSWSEIYIDCEIDPQTCNCTSLGSWFDYHP